MRCSKGPCANVNDNHCHFWGEKSSEKAWIFAGIALILALALLFLRNRYMYLSKNLIRKYFPTSVSADLSRLEVRDLDMANQVEIAAHLSCVYSSRGRNNRKALQRQIHFNVLNHWANTDVIKRVDCTCSTEVSIKMIIHCFVMTEILLKRV